MNFLEEKCTLNILSKKITEDCDHFSCNNSDLDNFFEHDCHYYSEQLLGKSYCFRLDENDKIIVCAFTLSNDSIKASHLPNGRKKKVTEEVPRAKQMKNYPAVLIGRLGVNKNYKGLKIGDSLMDFIKSWFINPTNKTGCRYIVVDSYNTKEAKQYYERNKFDFMFSTEEQEKEYTKDSRDGELHTRLMYFDLIKLRG